jgi:hypothetical protein
MAKRVSQSQQRDESFEVIEQLDQLVWTELNPSVETRKNIPTKANHWENWVTHQATLVIAGECLRVYKLNTQEYVIDARDVERLLKPRIKHARRANFVRSVSGRSR